LGGDVDVPLEIEGDDEERVARARDRAQLADALDGVDDFLDLLGDLRLHLLGRGARQLGADGHGWQVDRREAIDAGTEVAGGADDDQRQHGHRGEDGTADADFGELLHSSEGGYAPLPNPPPRNRLRGQSPRSSTRRSRARLIPRSLTDDRHGLAADEV